MPNNYFSFKQFTIKQGNCAMKVTTDACLFGAWVANQLNLLKPKNVLDIGAGTGLLSLMLAQQTANISVEMVEVDKDAAEQAQQNIIASPFAHQLQVHHQSIQEFTTNTEFDLIISNPPFYENSLPSISSQRNTALHSTYLPLQELVQQINRFCRKRTYIAILLPYHRMVDCEILMKGFTLVKKCLVQQSTQHSFFRVMFLYTNASNGGTTTIEEVSIKDGMNNYTPQFVTLLQPYYLFL